MTTDLPAAPDVALIVLAKVPKPGLVKTRLTPPCTPEEAASLAEAALLDTLDAVAAAPVRRRLLVLEGPAAEWVPPGFTVHAQRGDGLDKRLASAFEDAAGPALLVGMDTPQVRSRHLQEALSRWSQAGTDAAIGATIDGGYWSVGLSRPDDRVFHGVPMSSRRTGELQRLRFRDLGLTWTELAIQRDVDDIDDALAVASQAPHTRFSERMASVGRRWDGGVHW
ncbi:MAG: TIGR04282 family arsenosugar biosynthesis glycosyltransferase [Acidimicrobiales bacterium]